jgi:hypothetical protein
LQRFETDHHQIRHRLATARTALAVLTGEVRYAAGGWLAAECGVARNNIGRFSSSDPAVR